VIAGLRGEERFETFEDCPFPAWKLSCEGRERHERMAGVASRSVDHDGTRSRTERTVAVRLHRYCAPSPSTLNANSLSVRSVFPPVIAKLGL
jgi:hypothetical protein